MLTKNQAKRIHSLGNKKYRDRYKEFVVEGDKTVKELINSDLQITGLFATSAWIKKHSGIIPENCNIIPVTETQLKNISRQTTPNQVLAVVKIPEQNKIPTPQNELLLVLDGIQDPGNMGSILRTADWFGIQNIVCSEDTVDLYNPKVIQATMGSFCRVAVSYTNIVDYLGLYKNQVPVYGAFLNGENAFKKEFQENAILVLGNESNGISKEVSDCISCKITIPPFNPNREKKSESLNASASGAILMALFRMKK